MKESNNNFIVLRFPGFSLSWRNTLLGEISDVSKLAGYEFTKYIVYKDHGEIIALRGLNIKNNCLDLTEVKYIDSSDFTKLQRSKLIIGDILFTYIGTIGEVAIIQENDKYYLAPNVARIRVNQNIILPTFLLHYFNANKFKEDTIKKFVTSSSQPALTMENIRYFPIIFPSIGEQRKIADFLSSIDERIQLLRQKKEKLEQYKKGIMQQIFSRKLRFKDAEGKEFPKWKTVIFGEIYQFIPTNSLSRDMLHPSKGNVKNIHYGDIHLKYNIVLDLKYESLPFINNIHANIKDWQYCKIKDIIIADASEDYDGIGKTIEIIDTSDFPVVSGLHTIHARPKEDFFIAGFMGYQMQSSDIRKQIKTHAQGTKVLGISSKKIALIKIKVPLKEEQCQILNILSAMDLKTEQIEKQIELTETYKKGLLQQMFV